jgi:uncharacterized protein with LGFP repeats
MHASYNGLGLVTTLATAAILAACSGASGNIETSSQTTARVNNGAGAVLVQGEILAKYQSLGASEGALGLPVGLEQPAANGGRRQIFGGGAVYWSPQTGAHIVHGVIRTTWEYDYSGPAGPLGYPTSDEQPIVGGWKTQFEHGAITYTGGEPYVEMR